MLRQFCKSLISRADKAAPLLHFRMTSSSSGQKLAGKVAIVTASTEGIGFAIARRLCQDGAKVMLSSRKQQNVDTALDQLRAENLQASGMVCHVAKKEHREKLIDETIKQFGGVDILVSNAAANPYFGSMMSTPEDAWDKIFDTNVKATFMLCKEVVPHLEKRGAGSIVIISSIGGYQPIPMIGAYSVSKTALLGLVKAMAPELAGNNIRVNGLAPGIIKTKFSKALVGSNEGEQAALVQVPMGRLGESEDCSGAVSFLASEDSAFITGETILVTGGMMSRL